MRRSPCGSYFLALHSNLFCSSICSSSTEIWKEAKDFRSHCIQPPAVSTAAFSKSTGHSI